MSLADFPDDVQALLAAKNAQIEAARNRRLGLQAKAIDAARQYNRKAAQHPPEPPKSILNHLECAILKRMTEKRDCRAVDLYFVVPGRSDLTHKAAVSQIKKVLRFKDIPFIDNRSRLGGAFTLLDVKRAKALLR